jgi:hypothetical protein
MPGKETTMESLRSLPDISGRRFGNIAIGYDRIDQIRMEMGTLETLAALLCGVEREKLTLADVQRLLADLQTRQATLIDADFDALGDLDPRTLLAMAVRRIQQAIDA